MAKYVLQSHCPFLIFCVIVIFPLQLSVVLVYPLFFKNTKTTHVTLIVQNHPRLLHSLISINNISYLNRIHLIYIHVLKYPPLPSLLFAGVLSTDHQWSLVHNYHLQTRLVKANKRCSLFARNT